WSIPVAVLMVVPLGILGAVLATLLRGMERDVYFQVPMLTTVGLSSKNAIGTGVLGGMLAGTFLGVVFIPLFFVVVRRLLARGGGSASDEDADTVANH